MRSAMYYFFLLVVFFSCNVVCEDCMIFNFENGLEDFYIKGEICQGQDMWRLGNYSDLSMNGFHPQSSVFAFPLASWGCISSPLFHMQAGGTLEINLFMKPNVKWYEVFVFIVQSVENDMDMSLLSQKLILTEGWQSINITVPEFESFLGYVTFNGVAEYSSAFLVDSFRYIPPSMKEEECQIYKDVDVIDPEEDKKPHYSIFFMIKMGIIKILN